MPGSEIESLPRTPESPICFFTFSRHPTMLVHRAQAKPLSAPIPVVHVPAPDRTPVPDFPPASCPGAAAPAPRQLPPELTLTRTQQSLPLHRSGTRSQTSVPDSHDQIARKNSTRCHQKRRRLHESPPPVHRPERPSNVLGTRGPITAHAGVPTPTVTSPVAARRRPFPLPIESTLDAATTLPPLPSRPHPPCDAPPLPRLYPSPQRQRQADAVPPAAVPLTAARPTSPRLPTPPRASIRPGRPP